MLGDMVYETGRSANSQYFNLIGISAAKVGFVFGLGEFLGYCLRLFSGVASDKTGNYWFFLFAGYGLLVAVPLMGFSQNWNILLALILLERIGKALRNPSKDTILSSVAENQVGIGFAFGLQEALDQIGAFVGPLIFSLVFYLTGKNLLPQYQLSYKLLFIPLIALMVFLYYSKNTIEKNHLIPRVKVKEFRKESLPWVFWVYTAFTFFASIGFLNFSTIGYHIKSHGLMGDGNITLLYSMAMIVDAVTALVLGKAYDRLKEKGGKGAGLGLLIILPISSSILALIGLGTSSLGLVISMVVFGIILGTHETIMRSAIADISPLYKRGTSYGVFNTVYGLGLFIGAATMGLFYDMGKGLWISLFALLAQGIALIIYLYMKKNYLDKA